MNMDQRKHAVDPEIIQPFFSDPVLQLRCDSGGKRSGNRNVKSRQVPSSLTELKGTSLPEYVLLRRTGAMGGSAYILDSFSESRMPSDANLK